MRVFLIAAAVVIGSLIAALAILRAMIVWGDASETPIWMRQEAYGAAVDFALAKSDLSRNIPSLIAPDFTQQRDRPTKAGYLLDTFEPCALPSSELLEHTGLAGENCTASPGIGGVRYGAQCSSKSCVMVSVRDETWADPIARQVIMSTLNDHVTVCAYALAHGPNKRSDAWAAGCGRQRYQPVKLVVEVKPRLLHPCVDIPEGKGYRPVCSNPGSILHVVG